MNIERLQNNWDAFGKTDPFWAIVSNPKKKNNKWKRDEFFETGKTEINRVMKRVEEAGWQFPRKRALDFGCGVGRLTQALSSYFDEVSGVDIAPSMITLADEYNQYFQKCRYYQHSSNDLSIFPDNYFDFIYSNITLQHMEPKYSSIYIKEFIRVTSPGGLIVFQLLSRKKHIMQGKITLKQAVILLIPQFIFNTLLKICNKPIMEMYGMPKKDVVELIAKNKAKILSIDDNRNAGAWESFLYFVEKQKDSR